MFRSLMPETLTRAFLFAPAFPSEMLELGLRLTSPRLPGASASAISLTLKHRPESGTEVRIADGQRTLCVSRSPASQAGEPARLQVSARDGARPPVVAETTAADLAKLELPPSFKKLHAELLRWLQQSAPALFGGLAGNETPAAPQEQPLPANADAPAQSAGEEDERGSAPAQPALRTYTLARDGAPDMKFEGRLLASVVQPYRNARSHAFSVLETKGKRIIAVKTGLSMWAGERARQEIGTFDKLEDITGFFGFGDLAKALYDQLSLQTAEHVD